MYAALTLAVQSFFVRDLSAGSQFGMASADRAALSALFRSTDGAKSWFRKDNWGTDVDLSLWYGVQADADGRVVKLQLTKNNLNGCLVRLCRCPSAALLLLSAAPSSILLRIKHKLWENTLFVHPPASLYRLGERYGKP